MTSERFAQLVVSDDVVRRIRTYRQRLPELEALKAAGKKAEAQKITSLKSGLPKLSYQATFAKSLSKGGYMGVWRKQSAAVLNGLFMLDVDHVENPREVYKAWRGEEDADAWAEKLGILLVHITPSGHGLRIVAKADLAVGNIADNQAALSAKLGVEPDAACKDASRCSFCPMLEDILYINKNELFTYENKAYEEKYGPLYRGGNSQPTAVSEQHCETSDGQQQDHFDEQIEAGYHGTPYDHIVRQWLATVLGGKPQVGDRHQSLFRMACDLRYITDHNPKFLARVLEKCEVGQEVAAERGTDEIERIATDACARQRWQNIPQRVQRVLQAAGVQLYADVSNKTLAAAPAIDYAAWWHRLEPLLSESPVLREACVALPDHHKLAGVLAAGAMLGTYLTRCWWEHFDGKDYRLSFLVYIIGSAASGKSFIVDLDKLIMAPMLAADRVGREWERQYKEEMKKRAASSKNAKAEAPDQQHPVIRYVPSTISNAMLYRRLTDAIDPKAMGPDTQPIHLHCYTLEAELATALRAQQGSWAGKNDLELKSFHNEVAGVDYANDQSTNGIIQVNWNQVVSGTMEALSRKIRPANVLDGLVTRLVIFPMPQNDFAMIERRHAIRDHDREALLRSIGLKLEQVAGELKCERLVDFCYDYERQLTDEARTEQDLCLDYFRKRIPVIMMRYTLVRIVCREVDAAIKGEPLTVTDSDLEFARLIGDFCLMSQMHMFGQQVMDAQERERTSFTPRRRTTKVREGFARLPEEFSVETLVSEGVSPSVAAAKMALMRWQNDGIVKKVSDKIYRKIMKEIA